MELIHDIMFDRNCKVCGEERLMSTSVMADALKEEFNQVEAEFTVKLSWVSKQ